MNKTRRPEPPTIGEWNRWPAERKVMFALDYLRDAVRAEHRTSGPSERVKLGLSFADDALATQNEEVGGP